MLFSKYLEAFNVIQEINSIFEDSDVVQWDPNVGAEFKGVKGITGNVGKQQPQPRLDKMHARRGAEPGHIILVQNPTGKLQGFMVVGIDTDGVVAVNPQLQLRRKFPESSLEIAPDMLKKQIEAKYPDKVVWMVNPTLSVSL